jgi:hypothetical protein
MYVVHTNCCPQRLCIVYAAWSCDTRVSLGITGGVERCCWLQSICDWESVC